MGVGFPLVGGQKSHSNHDPAKSFYIAGSNQRDVMPIWIAAQI